MDNLVIIDSIKRLCKQNNITISQLENNIGLSQGLISRWAKSDPSLSKIIAIANYFHVSLDEVVGYREITTDRFLNLLISKTEAGETVWLTYQTEDLSPKRYYEPDRDVNSFYNIEDYTEYMETHIELNYYSCFNNGFIVIYAQYEKPDIFKPLDLKLFIQPTIDSDLVPQKYTAEELRPLWLKVLSVLGEAAPDEIKAEELKSSFISGKETASSSVSEMEAINQLMSNPDIMKLMETFNSESFRELQKTFSNPEFQKTMEITNKMQRYFNKK